MSEDKFVILGSKIRFIRMHLGLSQRELAERIGTTQAVISWWESGKHHPSPSHIPILLQALGTTRKELGLMEKITDMKHDDLSAEDELRMENLIEFLNTINCLHPLQKRSYVYSLALDMIYLKSVYKIKPRSFYHPYPNYPVMSRVN
jgi:transcriptional regulator with XRE-family HTH domain